MRLIDADALYLGKFVEPRTEWNQGWNDALDAATTQAPTIDAAPVVHGRWETNNDPEEIVKDFSCSVCEELLCDFDTSDLIPGENCFYYCPNCGAKMDGEDNESE